MVKTMEQTPPHSYANDILDAAGFKFKVQPLEHHRSRLDIKRLSSLDIDGVIRDVNTELLSPFVEDIVWCEINESDLKLYGDITIVKLIRVAQLIIEYMIHAKDTLASNLNALAKKYSVKKREIETLSKLLSPPQIASLGPRTSLLTAKPAFSHSPCSSHERSPIKSPDSKNEELKNDGFHLHIVSSTNAMYLRMNVEGSTTVQNLKNKLISRLLLVEGACRTNFDSHSFFYKDHELNDSCRTLNDYQVDDGAAVVFMPRRQPVCESNTLQSVASFSVSSEIESKLEQLTSIATASYEELLLATRAFQFQLSMQEASKETFLHEVGKQVRDALRSQEHQAIIAEDVSKHGETISSSRKPSITEVVKEKIDEHRKQDVALSANEQSHEPDVPDRVDVSTEGFNVVVSPFHPPIDVVSPFKMSCEIKATQNIETTDAMEEAETPKSMIRPVNEDLEIEFSMNSLNSMLDGADDVIDKRIASPTKGYLLYHGNADPNNDVAHANLPSNVSGGAKNKENDEQEQLSWSSDKLLADGRDSEGITEIIDHFVTTSLKISSGRTEMSDGDGDDMQSIAFSQSEPEITIHHAEVHVKKSRKGGKKKGHFHLLKKVTKGLLLSKN